LMSKFSIGTPLEEQRRMRSFTEIIEEIMQTK